MGALSSPVKRLIQHDFARDPWRVLACCIMLNRTGGKQVRHVLDDFFSRWPDAGSASRADDEELRGVLRHLGLHNRRAASIKRFSLDFTTKVWSDPRELHGIGLYGWEAYQIVCLGNSDVTPTDKVLARYLEYLKTSNDGDEEKAADGHPQLLPDGGGGDGRGEAVPRAAGGGEGAGEAEAKAGRAPRARERHEDPVAVGGAGGDRRERRVADRSRTKRSVKRRVP